MGFIYLLLPVGLGFGLGVLAVVRSSFHAE